VNISLLKCLTDGVGYRPVEITTFHASTMAAALAHRSLNNWEITAGFMSAANHKTDAEESKMELSIQVFLRPSGIHRRERP